jgi:hypothetical protein
MNWVKKMQQGFAAAVGPGSNSKRNDTMRVADIGIQGKIFCLSMQRSGTSSVGDFLEQWGLRRAGHPVSRRQDWSRCWYNGNYEGIFSNEQFRQFEVFEDDPFWFPDFFKVVYHRVPGSRFILLNRDSDSWFKSMVRHSNGYSIGRTDIHAKVYGRQDELRWLAKNVAGFDPQQPRSMVLYDKAAHYKAAYERHTAEVEAFFTGPRASSFFMAKLGHPDTFPRMKEWLGLPDKEGVQMEVHTHKSKSEFGRAQLLREGGRAGGRANVAQAAEQTPAQPAAAPAESGQALS